MKSRIGWPVFLALALCLILSPVHAQDGQNVYRLYNRNSGEHLFTESINEYRSLERMGWSGEGVAWIAPLQGNAVWRFYNPALADHLYTYNAQEMAIIIWQGWNYDYYLPVFYSGGTIPIYRLYNPTSKRHLLTTSLQEYNALGTLGWIKEGAPMRALSLGS